MPRSADSAVIFILSPVSCGSRCGRTCVEVTYRVPTSSTPLVSKLHGHSSIAVANSYRDNFTSYRAVEALAAVDLPGLGA